MNSKVDLYLPAALLFPRKVLYRSAEPHVEATFHSARMGQNFSGDYIKAHFVQE
jgi:hypothetical protein